ncbi:hypothetical protein FDP41_011063 [Naegleria fowleri]|uniref:SAM domain-containing protein n=1 Tax=Naegleria fowleri TaxID=5763 RepID=A0A6A5CCN0_NAEFO|nr:uncharacterized protein FDP41_011063 [Naegleria fowleri]KAF0983085.1 hypothetical protein FDP41_011063 [Naegleria fowleri]
MLAFKPSQQKTSMSSPFHHRSSSPSSPPSPTVTRNSSLNRISGGMSGVTNTTTTTLITTNSSPSGEFSNVSDLLKTYNNFESFIQQNDGKQRLKEYLESSRNEEQLLFVEIMEPYMAVLNPKVSCSTFPTNNNNNNNGKTSVDVSLNSLTENDIEWSSSNEIIMESVKNVSRRRRPSHHQYNPQHPQHPYNHHHHSLVQPSSSSLIQQEDDSPHWTFLDLCKIVFTQFLQDDSPYELNVSSKLKASVKKALISNSEEEAKKSLKSLYHQVLSQMKEEAFKHLRQSEDFKIWVLSKAIDFSQKAEQHSVQSFLEENEMAENWSLFKKKKLFVMKDIRDMTEEDFRKLGVKKLGHVKRLVRRTMEHFSSATTTTVQQ